MAFIRLVGCSVGQKVCTHCDTDFDKTIPELGGGLFTVQELLEWSFPYEHICLTGGEPLDRDIRPLLCEGNHLDWHVETSGTVLPDWLDLTPKHERGRHMIQRDNGTWMTCSLWLTVSPKPGWDAQMIARADEIKVILGGLSDDISHKWPDLKDALTWADENRLVYVQPRNDRMDIRESNLKHALDVVQQNPRLRLSVQLHKFIRTR